jgi:hypothetical protein
MPQNLLQPRPDIWVPDDLVGWRHASNIDTKVMTADWGEIRLLTDSNGHRIGRGNRSEATYRVLAVGDSFLEGLQVDHEHTITGRLENELSKQLDDSVVVVNTGVSQWGPNHYLLEVKQELARSEYDVVLVFLFTSNDLVAQKLDKIPVQQPGKAHRLRLPKSLEFSEFIDAIAVPINEFLRARSHLYTLVKNRTGFLRMKMGLSAHYIPFLFLRSQADSPQWNVTADICAEIAAVGEVYNTPILFVLLPGVYEVDEIILEKHLTGLEIDPTLVDSSQPSRLFISLLKARKLKVVNTKNALKVAHTQGQNDLYGQVDPHFGPGGHKVVADVLTPIVLSLLVEQ